MANLSAEKATTPEFSVTPNYRRYVLGILVTVYTFNYLDRQILSILLQPIKEDMGLSDTALGFLTGVVFAIFYATLGLPIARFADKANRKMIVSGSLAIWSGMTALCGTAQNFWQLAAYRIGVGVGEAGGSPPSYSLLSDYYAPEERATALATYALGVPFGILFGYALGGIINDLFDWRTAFFVVGLPGVLLAVVVWFTVKEPPRGLSEGKVEANAAAPDAPPMMEVVRHMWGQRTLRHVIMGGTLTSFVGYGFVIWAPSFLIRSHGMSVGDVGLALSLIIGISGGIGTYFGGWFADKLGKKDIRWRSWVVAIPIVVSLPFGVGMYLSDNITFVLIFMIIPGAVGSLFLGPSLAMVQGLVTVRMRAFAGAVFLFVLNLIALGLGPQLVGLLSDMLIPAFGDDSLRYALLFSSVLNIWAALHYVLAARTLAEDTAKMETL
ncbi:MAG: spinster family MFS transporter [Alphaproteobacteria bacterium]